MTDKEKIELVEYDDDYVKIVCTSEYDRYVTLNDYHNDDWVAYVNGEQVDIETANYMMRAVKIKSGDNIVIEFCYRPTKQYVVIGIFAVTVLLTAAAFVFRRRLQRMVDAVCGEKSIKDNER